MAREKEEVKDPGAENESAFDKFKSLSRCLVHVPKKEVDRKDKALRAKKKLKK